MMEWMDGWMDGWMDAAAYLRVGHHDNWLELGDSLGHISVLLLCWLGIFSPQHAAVRPAHPSICMGLKLTCRQAMAHAWRTLL